MPANSSTQTIVQDFGLGKIELTYSRPNLKGRNYFEENSELAPLGKLWRTGANAATRLRFTDAVNMGGKDIDSGRYALYTIPGAKEWTIIINKGFNNSGTSGYTEADDVVRFTVPVYTLDIQPIETFSMQFDEIKPESCDLLLMWGKKIVVIPISTKIKERLKTNMEQALKGDKPPYWQAANYYYDWEKDYQKALNNVNRALETNPDAFYMYMLRAKINKELGNTADAKADALKCKELATKANNEDYVKQADKFLQAL